MSTIQETPKSHAETSTSLGTAVVLGAGVSGLTAAYVLSKEGWTVRVIDTYPTAGGNHISLNTGGYSFDVGSIFFWADNPQFQMFPEVLKVCTPSRLTIERLAPEGPVRRYPIDREDFSSGGIWGLIRIFASLALSRLRVLNPRNADEYSDYYVGRYLKEKSGLKYFLQRFYDIPAEKISIDFTRARMDWMRQNGSVREQATKLARRILKPKSSKRSPEAQVLNRPFEGFPVYYKAMSDQLRAEGVDFMFDQSIEKIVRNDAAFEVTLGDQSIRADRLISTLPVNTSLRLCGLPERPQLKSSRLVTLCCSFAGKRGFTSVVLYNFDRLGVWKRLTMHSDYYGRRHDREFMCVECIATTSQVSAEDMFAEFRQQTSDRGVFVGDLKLEAVLELDHAYPIYEHGAEAARSEALEALYAFGVESLGRQGKFDYIPHSTIAIDAVKRYFDERGERKSA